MSKGRLVLGIESSCDETGLALVRSGVSVHASVVTSQVESHQKFGGVVPEIAAREHLSNIQGLCWELFEKTEISPQEIDIIAVTQGPGLIGSLLVGASFAHGLAFIEKKPLIPVNHVHAHIYSVFLEHSERIEEIFPAFALVVSGGHTHLYLMTGMDKLQLLAYSEDDACGEAFDKVAKLLGFSYPGGAQVETLALKGDISRYKMPKMMKDSSSLQLSYSGLKTHVANLVHSQYPHEQDRADICAAFQHSAFEQIIRKLTLARKHYDTKSILLAGGVASNHSFRKMIRGTFPDIPLFCPEMNYCADNGAMIASAGYFTHSYPKESDWEVFSTYPYGRLPF